MDGGASDLYESYSQDYAQIAASVKDKLKDGGEAKTTKGEAQKAVIRRINMELEEGDEILAQMDIELQSLPKEERTKKQIQLRSWHSEMNRWKSEAKTLMSTSDRDDLLSRAGGGHTSISIPLSPTPPLDGSSYTQAQRERLLKGTDVLEDGQRRLDDSHRIALETEDLGAGILRDLRGQREQIEGTRDTLTRADSSIDKASGTLKKMIRRMYQQRIITILIIVVLLILIGIVLYSKLR